MILRRWTRALPGAAGLVAACAVAGCGTTGSGGSSSSSSVTATGRTLSIYLSAPRAADAVDGDVVAAEQLAFKQQSHEVTRFGLRLVLLRKPTLPDNARAAIQDKSTIAYLGEIAPGDSEQTVGITNALDTLELSPTDTALELNTRTPAVAGAPNRYYESVGSYGRTFARIVPSSEVEARRLVAEMKAVRVHSLYVTDDGSDYGRALAAAVRADLAPAGLSPVTSTAGADGMFYAGSNARAAGRAVAQAASAHPALKVFAPSALADPAFATAVGSGVRSLYVSVPQPAGGPRSAEVRAFNAAFAATYGHRPAPQAAFGFEAMSALLSVLEQAGGAANNRTTVVNRFHSIKNRASVVGTFSIDGAGNSTLTSFGFLRLRRGSLVPLS